MKIQFLGTGNAFSDFRVNYNNNALDIPHLHHTAGQLQKTATI